MERLPIPECTYTHFSRGLHDAAAQHRLPIQGSLELTAQCNLGCAHCYVVGARREPGDDLSTQEVYHLLDDLAEAGCLWLCLTGGEPLMREDFWDIYHYAKSKGFLITLFTNGTLVTPRVAERLAEFPPFSIEVSLYGMSDETYHQLTGLRGAFAMAMRGIHLLLERKLRLKLKTTLLTVNKHELSDMKRLARDLGLSFRYDYFITPKVDGSLAPAHFRLSPQEVIALEQADEERSQAFKDWARDHGGYAANDHTYSCGAGFATFYITSQGKLQLCVMSRPPAYDLRKGSFHDGFYRVFPALLSQKVTRGEACQRCAFTCLCNRCPAWASLERGELDTPTEYACEIARGLGRALALEGVMPRGSP